MYELKKQINERADKIFKRIVKNIEYEKAKEGLRKAGVPEEFWRY